MPLLAENIVHLFSGVGILRKYDDNVHHLLNPKNKIVEELHAISAVLKAKNSWFSSTCIT